MNIWKNFYNEMDCWVGHGSGGSSIQGGDATDERHLYLPLQSYIAVASHKGEDTSSPFIRC